MENTFKRYSHPRKYQFYVLDISDNRVINGFDDKGDCKEFISDQISEEGTKQEQKEELKNYKIIGKH